MTRKHFNELNKALASRYVASTTPEEGECILQLLNDIADIGASFNERFNYEMWNVAFKKNVERFENQQELQTAEHLLMNSN